jgi:hypothetical protein
LLPSTYNYMDFQSFLFYKPTRWRLFQKRAMLIKLDIYVFIKCINSGPSWLYGSWIYNCLCNQYLSTLKLWVQAPFMAGCILDTTLCDKVCQWLAPSLWFYQGTPVSSTNKTDCHNITEILLKVALNTINQPTYLM